jgi:hypothetical protein
MEPGGSMPRSQGLSNNPYPEPNQPNYLRCYLFLQGPFYYCPPIYVYAFLKVSFLHVYLLKF